MALSKGDMTKTTVDVFSSDDEQIDMTIHAAAFGRIMDRLTDLYEAPIESSVRETFSNALDSVDENGVIKITQPTVFNPFFVIEDNGSGMTTDFVRNGYVHYGASTKIGDFKKTGAYGLGAKSPLAYTDEFFIETTSAIDGVTTEFSVGRTSAGPKATITSVENTGRSSGTTVRIPVNNPDDFSKFKDVVDKYVANVFSLNAVLVVDGKVVDKDKGDWLPFGEVLIEEEENLYGRMWVNKDSVFYKGIPSNDAYFRFDYVLSGFPYANPEDKSRIYHTPSYLIELHPGVVEFSTSRDSIVSDDRSKLVNTLIHSQLSADAFMKRTLDLYRDMSNKEAFNFVKHTNARLTNENKGVFIGNRDQVKLNIEDFTTKNGYNPYKEDVRFANEKNIYGMVFMIDDSKLLYIDPRSSNRDDTKSILAIKNTLFSNLEVDKNISALETASNISRELYYANNIRRIMFLSDVDTEDKINQVIRNRKVFDVNYFVFSKGSISKDEKAAIHDRFLDPSLLSFLSYDDFMKIVEEERAAEKEARKAAAKAARNNPVEPTFSGRVIENGFSSLEEIVDRNLCIPHPSLVKISEYKEKNALFYVESERGIGRHLFQSAVNGMYDSGENILNRPIVIFVRPTKDVFTKIGDKSVLFASTNYDARSALAQEMTNGRMFYKDIQEDRVAALKNEDLFKELFFRKVLRRAYNRYNARSHVEYSYLSTVYEFAEKAKKVSSSTLSSTDKFLAEYDRLNTEYENYANSDFSDIEDQAIEKVLWSNQVDHVNRWQEASKKFGYDSEFKGLRDLFSVTKSDEMRSHIAVRFDELLDEIFFKDMPNKNVSTEQL